MGEIASSPDSCKFTDGVIKSPEDAREEDASEALVAEQSVGGSGSSAREERGVLMARIQRRIEDKTALVRQYEEVGRGFSLLHRRVEINMPDGSKAEVSSRELNGLIDRLSREIGEDQRDLMSAKTGRGKIVAGKVKPWNRF
ncbi:MAG: hypothetical protein WC480_02725 [Patescibacteria group bacterium]